MKKEQGITLISLVITIIILVILSAIGIYLALGNNGLVPKAQEAEEKTTKEVATEKMNLKITNRQIEIYTKEERMPTLQEFADGLCEDNEIEYVELESKKIGSLGKIDVGENESIYTKLKEYPYEFEIDSSLRLTSINGVKVATATNDTEKFDYGIATIPSGASWRIVYVNFNKDFTTNPVVVTQPMQINKNISDGSDAIGGQTQWEVVNVTTEGFYIRLYNNSFQDELNLYWIAIGK